MMLSLLPIKTANASVKHNSDQISVYQPYLPNHKSLTLRWRSFSEWGAERVAVSYAYKSSQYIGYA